VEIMKIKYIPVYDTYNTVIEYIDESTIKIDDELYEFDTESVEWPDIFTQTNGKITSARRDETGELYIEVVRTYYYENAGAVIPQPEWDTGDYHDING